MKIDLTKSRVVFDEAAHQYYLGTRRLMGITGLIHDVLKLGVYPEASEYVRQFLIPKAGEYGSAVHKAIETYEELGVAETLVPRSPLFGGGTWDVSAELESYIRNRRGYANLASEYNVTDGVKWASNIDNVWVRESDGAVVLADTKTNNLEYYPGKASGLKEYLSWQLSVYARLFELQNPGLGVAALACNWLRRGDSALWEIPRKPDWMVDALLLADWSLVGGDVVYCHPCPEMLSEPTLPRKMTAPEQASPPAFAPSGLLAGMDPVDAVVRIQSELAKWKELSDQMRASLKEAMLKAGARKWDAGKFTASIRPGTSASVFDSARFKKDHPGLWKEYSATQARPAALVIKLRAEEP